MAEQTTGLMSGVREVQAPDGTTFDIMRGAPESAAQIRGSALVKMREIVQSREPGVLQYLQTRPGISSEYAMSSGIMHSENPDVKADLVRVSVGSHLEEGDRAGAVSMLAYAQAAELPLSEYGEDFISQQYEESLQENNPRHAWSIAQTMMSKRDKIVKTDPHITQEKLQEWTEKEKKAFVLYAEDVLDLNLGHVDIRDYVELAGIFDLMKLREDGYGTGANNDLAGRVADTMIGNDLARGKGAWALRHAIEASMPDSYIAKLRKEVSPTAVEMVKNWWDRLITKAEQIIGKR